MFHEGRPRIVGLAALALVSALLTTGTTNGADRKSEPEEGRPLTFKSKVIHAPEMAGMSKSVVLEALQAYETDRQAGRIGKGEEKRALRERLERAFRLNRSGAGLTQKSTASGSTTVDLEGRFQYVYLSRTDEDGTTSIVCVEDWEGAEAFLNGAGPGAAERK